MLEARCVTVVYPNGTVANDCVSLAVREGEVLGLLGENGAGKTTLVRVLAGELRPTSGEVLLSGRPARFRGPRDALRAGVVLVPQHPRLFEGLTVAEDAWLALRAAGVRVGLREAGRLVARAARDHGLEVDPDAPVHRLSFGERQRVEIAKALALGARVLLLDEPTTHLSPGEAEAIVELARGLARAGRAVVFITHKIAEALEASDRIAVMRRGRLEGVVGSGEATPERLLSMMFGEPPEAPGRHPRPAAPGPAVLEVEDLWVRAWGAWAVRGASLEVRPGEVVGVAGVAGNGQRELFEAIAGLRRPSRGRVIVSGVDVTGRPPSARRPLGVAVIPEERLGWALVPGKSVVFNVAISHAFTKPGLAVDWQAEREAAAKAVESMEVRAPGLDAPVDSLSGGNMQRLVVARELLPGPRLVLAMNPTAGLDYRGAQAVRWALEDAAARGAGVLVFSEDLDELLDMADRLYVMARGRVRGPYRPPYDYAGIAAAMAS